MPTTTLKDLLESFVEEYSLGRLGVTTSTGDTSSLIDLTRFGRPSAGNEWQRDTPIRITGRAAVAGGGITIGSESFLSDFDPSTGDFTVSPVFNDTPEVGASFIVLNNNVADSSDRLVEALNRFLKRVARRRDKVVMTQAGQAATLRGPASLWTLSNATVSYVDGDAWEPQLSRWLAVLATAGNGYASTAGASAAEDEVYDFYVPVWPGSGASAQVVIRDDTAGANITPTYYSGSATITGISRQTVRGTFTVPADCHNVSVRLLSVTNATTVLFGPVFLQKQGARTMPIPVELEYIQDLGRLFTIDNLPGTTRVVAGTMDEWRPVDAGYTLSQLGFGTVLQAQEPLPFPLLFEATIPYPELVAGDPTAAASGSAATESDTTYCPKDLALAGMAVEFFKWAQREERQQRGPDSHSTRWDGRLNDAEAALVTAQSDWNAKKQITVRRHFSGRAYA